LQCHGSAPLQFLILSQNILKFMCGIIDSRGLINSKK
jgi:hypothetical protein